MIKYVLHCKTKYTQVKYTKYTQVNRDTNLLGKYLDKLIFSL